LAEVPNGALRNEVRSRGDCSVVRIVRTWDAEAVLVAQEDTSSTVTSLSTWDSVVALFFSDEINVLSLEAK
jgi:hypothetical protein